MKIKFDSFYLYTLLYICFIVCDGCNYNQPPLINFNSRIVKDIQLDSNNIVQIQIEKLKKENIGFNYKLNKPVEKSSHIIHYNLKLNNRPYRNEVFKQDAINNDSLDQHRNDISVQLSKDKLHLLLKYGNIPIGVYHMLDSGMPFTTTIDPQKVKTMAKDFDLNVLQDPENIMIAHIEKIKDYTSDYNNTYIKKTLNAQKSPSSLDKKLLDYIGYPLADSFFTISRIKKLCTSLDTKWRTKAIKKIYRIIGKVTRAKDPINQTLEREANGAVNIFTRGMNDYIDKRAIERQILPKYPLYPYAIILFNDSEEDRILSKTEVGKINSNCKKVLSVDTFRNALPAPTKTVNCAIEFLIRYRDDSNLKSFEESMASIFRKQILKDNVKTIDDEIFYPYSTRFSEAEQRIILNHARKLAIQMHEEEDAMYLNKFLKNIDSKAK
ncbi:MAG: hypothetical protein MK207_04495 [Saprospiraceae bacterium]|nr:hypothetical protein [Saprospiraceae bacterium]